MMGLNKKYKPPILAEERGTPLVMDHSQDSYAYFRVLNKIWHKQRMGTLKFLAALCYLQKSKHPRFMLKTTRKNLIRRKR